MGKRMWSTIISSAIIIGAGAGGVFWIHSYSADQLQAEPRLAVVNAKETETAASSPSSKTAVKKTRKQIIEETQKKVVTIESSSGLLAESLNVSLREEPRAVLVHHARSSKLSPEVCKVRLVALTDHA